MNDTQKDTLRDAIHSLLNEEFTRRPHFTATRMIGEIKDQKLHHNIAVEDLDDSEELLEALIAEDVATREGNPYLPKYLEIEPVARRRRWKAQQPESTEL